MRLGRIQTTTGTDFVLQAGAMPWVSFRSLGIHADSTAQAIAACGDVTLEALGSARGETNAELVAPIAQPSKVIAIGLNYGDHIRETGVGAPEYPVAFAKFPNSINGPTDEIVVANELTEQLDYECELAVVIGRPTRSIAREEALNSVFGYAVANDVSAREWQWRDVQYSRSKSFDTFCPIGPWITTADEVNDPQGLALSTLVNGEVRQKSSTAEMIFSVEYLIWYLARGMTLEPGDVLLTGTPHGVGFAMDPPRFLAHGDVVVCEIEKLGRLTNRVCFLRGGPQ